MSTVTAPTPPLSERTPAWSAAATRRFDGAVITPTKCTLALYVKLKGGVREVVIDDLHASDADVLAAIKALTSGVEPAELPALLGLGSVEKAKG